MQALCDMTESTSRVKWLQCFELWELAFVSQASVTCIPSIWYQEISEFNFG